MACDFQCFVQGRILRYAGLPDSAKVARRAIPGKEGKPSVSCMFNMPLQVFAAAPDSKNPSPDASIKVRII